MIRTSMRGSLGLCLLGLLGSCATTDRPQHGLAVPAWEPSPAVHHSTTPVTAATATTTSNDTERADPSAGASADASSSPASTLRTDDYGAAYDDRHGWGPDEGDWEVTLSGVGSNDADFSVGGFQLNGNVGYFLTDQLEVGLRQTVSFADSSSTNSRWDGVTRGALDFLIPIDDRFYPFVGGSIGYVYGDSFHETWAAGPEGGLRFYVKPETFVQAQIEYQFFFDKASRIDNNFDDGSFLYSLGFGINF